MDEPREETETPGARRRLGLGLFVVVALFVVYDVICVLDLFRHGSPEDLEHASERIGDLSTGPNAP